MSPFSGAGEAGKTGRYMVNKHLRIARRRKILAGGREACLRMRLQTLCEAQTIGMRLVLVGHMCAACHFGAEGGGFGIERRNRRSAGQKGLQHERIEGEGGKPLPQPRPDMRQSFCHGEDQAPKNRRGQAGMVAPRCRRSASPALGAISYRLSPMKIIRKA